MLLEQQVQRRKLTRRRLVAQMMLFCILKRTSLRRSTESLMEQEWTLFMMVWERQLFTKVCGAFLGYRSPSLHLAFPFPPPPAHPVTLFPTSVKYISTNHQNFDWSYFKTLPFWKFILFAPNNWNGIIGILWCCVRKMGNVFPLLCACIPSPLAASKWELKKYAR